MGGYLVQGTLYYGVSNGAAYGDDAQMDSNYPLVRIINDASGDVCYTRVYSAQRPRGVLRAALGSN